MKLFHLLWFRHYLHKLKCFIYLCVIYQGIIMISREMQMNYCNLCIKPQKKLETFEMRAGKRPALLLIEIPFISSCAQFQLFLCIRFKYYFKVVNHFIVTMLSRISPMWECCPNALLITFKFQWTSYKQSTIFPIYVVIKHNHTLLLVKHVTKKRVFKEKDFVF